MSAYRYQPGDRPLEGYTIQYALGRGGFGEVYFAVSDAGREVALKSVQNYEDIELRGISHCMNLKSPHLVMIFDVKTAANGLPWVIMEYVSGPSLREILDDAPEGIGNEQAAFFLRELAKGLTYLHNAGVVHRDLKPHNVFFEDGLVKIGDYSLSKAISTSHRSGHTMTVGSVHYMAPEISVGRYDKTVDIYALGVMLFEMLTGTPPYVGESMGEVLMKHLSSQPDVSGLAEPFASTVKKAMARDPSDRFQTAEALVESLGQLGQQGESHSFNPLTLSMIGERANALQANRANRPPAPLVETFTTPAALKETKKPQPAVRNSVPSGAPMVSRLGLWDFEPANDANEQEPDQVWLLARIPMAIIASMLLIPLGCAADDVHRWIWGDILLVTILQAFVSLIAGLVFCRHLPRRNGWGWGILSRLIALIPTVLVILFFAFGMSPRKLELYWDLFLGLLTVQLVFDWRCFVNVARYPRVGVLKTLLLGLTTMLLVTLFNFDNGNYLLGGAIMIAAAIAIQLVAPFSSKAVKQAPETVDAEIVGSQQGDASRQKLRLQTPVQEVR